MKWWYLLCGYTQEYALVYARNEKEAFEKLMSKRKIDTRDYNQWEFEELKPDSYDGRFIFLLNKTEISYLELEVYL